MRDRDQALQTLLRTELPLGAVGPHLRRAVRSALATGDDERLVILGRVIVGELLRKGELLRLVMENPAASGLDPVPLCLLRGTKRVVDLSPLGMKAEVSQSIAVGNATWDQVPKLRSSPPVLDNLTDFAGVLGAMEDAQDLDIGDPQSADKALVLSGILRLLRKFAPQFHLSIMLAESEALPDLPEGVFQVPVVEAEGTWLAFREPGQAVWISSASELPQQVQMQREFGPDGRATSAVAVPIWEPNLSGDGGTEPRETGVMFVVTSGEWPRESLLRLAERLARFVTRRWHRQHEVNQRIHTDSLTGVFNRAFFDTRFTLELERARRSEVPLTLVIADIDHFKQVNDRLGHQCGDRTLQMVARRLQEELRRIDLICRIGGEEFALILPDTGQEAGQEVMGRLIEAPLHEDIESEEGPIALDVTFSYGAVTFPAAGADAFELYRKADAMLYLSKDLGRNQCHFWNRQGDHLRMIPASGAKQQ